MGTVLGPVGHVALTFFEQSFPACGPELIPHPGHGSLPAVDVPSW